MSREVHVRFWESAGVRFPRATQLPLFRLVRMFRSYGVDLSENTLGDWVKESAELLSPIVEVMHRELLQSYVVHADETRITVLGPGEGKVKSRKCWIWVYL